MKKLVSICIPTYNGENFISKAIESALRQKYGHLEIIVSDDASIDATVDIVTSFKGRTNIPIHIYKHIPSGIGANWNNCIEKAKGTYIKFLFQDDVLEPQCVERMVRLIESDNSIGLVASKRQFIVESSFDSKETQNWINKFKDLQENLLFEENEEVIILNKNLFKSPFFLKAPLNKVGEPSTYLFKKELINEVGEFRKDLKQKLDYEFCYRVLKKYDIAILKEPLVKFRLHSLQATQKNKVEDSNDNKIYNYILYKEFLFLLHRSVQINLLKKHHPFFRVYRQLRKILQR